jgi:hypothetical protein
LNSAGKHFLVILLSFVVVGGSGIVTYTIWSMLPYAIGTFERAALSLFTWVVTFYVGAFLLWRTVLVVSRYN